MKNKILWFLLVLCLASCGDSDTPHTFEIQGEVRECVILSVEPCGLSVACVDNGGLHQCVSN